MTWRLVAAVLVAGCASNADEDATRFHTSGSREADQRAEQRINKVEQMRGEGEGGSKSGKTSRTLYERLGGADGVRRIVDDFVDRALADPRANWRRQGIQSGGVIGIGQHSVEWTPTPEGVRLLKQRMAEFIALATGGPSVYQGRNIKDLHKGMRITNAEFDATVGDLKASLDALRLPTEEQKELLAIFESTRPQVAEER